MRRQLLYEFLNVPIDRGKALFEIPIGSTVRILNVRANRTGPKTEQSDARHARYTLPDDSQQLRRLEHDDQIARQDQRRAKASRPVIL